MVERRIELDRRYHRKKKMKKLKLKLQRSKDSRDREAILHKIHLISPHWQEVKPGPRTEPKPEPRAAAPAKSASKKH